MLVEKFGEVNMTAIDELVSPAPTILVTIAARAFCRDNSLDSEREGEVLMILLNDQDYARFGAKRRRLSDLIAEI